MIRLKMENFNIILTEKLQKHQPYHQAYLKYEYLTGEERLLSNQRQIVEQDKFTFSPLGKAFEKKQKQLKIKEKNKLKL